MSIIKDKGPGVIFTLLIAFPSWFLGIQFPIVGAPVFAILIGMIITIFYKDKKGFGPGIQFTSKKVLHWAVILLGFGLNLRVVVETGKQSLPIIISTIAISLIIAFLLHKVMKIDSNIATLVGVGSSICGGSAIAATAPVINAKDEEIAQSISIIFFFNVLAALIFPSLGALLGFSHETGDAFGIFAGTAVNDTSSVTACASTWDSMWNLGSQAIDKAVTVKLTRTLAIIPITLFLAFFVSENKKEEGGNKVTLKQVFPFFILYFILASVITTVATSLGVSGELFAPFKVLSKFFIVMAMAAIGLNTNIVHLIKTGGKPLFMGFSCWVGITLMSLFMQKLLHIW